jgi:hypothetical protein
MTMPPERRSWRREMMRLIDRVEYYNPSVNGSTLVGVVRRAVPDLHRDDLLLVERLIDKLDGLVSRVDDERMRLREAVAARRQPTIEQRAAAAAAAAATPRPPRRKLPRKKPADDHLVWTDGVPRPRR